jgi:hypothetical protein
MGVVLCQGTNDRIPIGTVGTYITGLVLGSHMTDTTKPRSRPIFTPSTLPQPTAPDPVVAFIEDALLEIANRQEEDRIPAPSK